MIIPKSPAGLQDGGGSSVEGWIEVGRDGTTGAFGSLGSRDTSDGGAACTGRCGQFRGGLVVSAGPTVDRDVVPIFEADVSGFEGGGACRVVLWSPVVTSAVGRPDLGGGDRPGRFVPTASSSIPSRRTRGRNDLEGVCGGGVSELNTAGG